MRYSQTSARRGKQRGSRIVLERIHILDAGAVGECPACYDRFSRKRTRMGVLQKAVEVVEGSAQSGEIVVFAVKTKELVE